MPQDCSTTPAPMAAGRALLALVALFGVMAASIGTLAAQTVNCAAIQAQIASLSRQTSPRDATWRRAAQRQQVELARTVGYANTLGCNRQRFLFFGDPPPPQCGALNQRIAAMQANLGRLQSAVQNGGGDAQRRTLIAQFDAYCRNQVAAAPPRGFFDQLFGGQQGMPPMREMPIGPPPRERDQDMEEDRGPRIGSTAVCVRKCDGGFFPVSYSASRSNFSQLADLCAALCPNAETILLTKRQDAEIDEAQAFTGDTYESLANAGKFKRTYDPTCTCKPANRTWAQVLANAETLIASRNRRDEIITAARADELSRPKLTAVQMRALHARPAAAAATQPTEEDKAVAALEREGRAEAEAASRSNAGIAPGSATTRQNFTVRDGQREEIILSDGSKRSVRVIGPRT